MYYTQSKKEKGNRRMHDKILIVTQAQVSNIMSLIISYMLLSHFTPMEKVKRVAEKVQPFT